MKRIIFSTPMVRAILEERKTQTRRVIKLPGPHSDVSYFEGDQEAITPITIYGEDGSTWEDGEPINDISNRYKPGDILRVAETWRCIRYDNMDGNMNYGVEFKDGEQKHFQFDDHERYRLFGKYATKKGWQSPFYMPLEATRLFLRAKNIWVERLQDITEEDAAAEGVGDPYDYQNLPGLKINTLAYAKLWDILNAKRGYGWDTNPWVRVIEFEKISKEEANNE